MRQLLLVPALWLCLACSRGGGRPLVLDDLAMVDSAGVDIAVAVDGSADAGFADLGSPADLSKAPADLSRPPADLSTAPDLFSGVLNVRILVSNTCRVTTDPPSFGVRAGTSFTVNWINLAASASPVDVAKIDQFNQVPILINLKPTESYHDAVRAWCGALFTGTFSFRVTGCDQPYYMPIDCNAP